MDKMVRILVAVELPVDVEAVKSAIDRRPGGCDFLVTKTLAEFSAALESFKPVVIVADYHLTRFDGMAALKLARKRFPGIPFVFIVNSIDEMNDSAYCEDECWDHISKARLDQLGFLIQNILAAYTRLKIGTKVSRTAFMKRERQLITLMQNLPGMVFQCRNDRAWTMEFVNEGSFSLTGYHPE